MAYDWKTTAKGIIETGGADLVQAQAVSDDDVRSFVLSAILAAVGLEWTGERLQAEFDGAWEGTKAAVEEILASARPSTVESAQPG